MRAAASHEAVVDKFIGDGALLLLGVPNPHSDDCARAIACAPICLRSSISGIVHATYPYRNRHPYR